MVELFALSIPILLLTIPIVALVTRYHLERLKIQSQNEAGSVAQLRKSLEELRDTATQYDLALDQTLQRIERRLDELENRIAQLEQTQSQQLLR